MIVFPQCAEMRQRNNRAIAFANVVHSPVSRVNSLRPAGVSM
jgi:hypothetical protein